MNEDLEERLIASWEAIARGLGEFNEIARGAISKQWPEARERRDAIVTKLLTPEEKLKVKTGNTDGPIDEWLGEFDPEDEIGPREREFLARQAEELASSKAAPKAGGQSGAGIKTPRS